MDIFIHLEGLNTKKTAHGGPKKFISQMGVVLKNSHQYLQEDSILKPFLQNWQLMIDV